MWKQADLFGEPYPGQTPQKQEDWSEAAPSEVPWPDIDPAMWYRINGEDIDMAQLPMKGGQPIYVHQGTAYADSDHPGLVEWAADSGLKLAAHPGLMGLPMVYRTKIRRPTMNSDHPAHAAVYYNNARRMVFVTPPGGHHYDIGKEIPPHFLGDYPNPQRGYIYHPDADDWEEQPTSRPPDFQPESWEPEDIDHAYQALQRYYPGLTVNGQSSAPQKPDVPPMVKPQFENQVWSTLHEAEYPGGGQMADKIKRQQDIEMFNHGDPDFKPEQAQPEWAEPRGPFACSQCDYKPRDLADYRMHVEYEHNPQDVDPFEDGHFPQIDDFDEPLPLRRTQPKPNGGETVAGMNLNHNLWHQPGNWGRGLVTDEGSVYTWPEEEGTHTQRTWAMNIPNDMRRQFAIGPRGQFRMHYNDLGLEPHVQSVTGLSPIGEHEYLSSVQVIKLPDSRACYQIPQFEIYSKIAGFETPTTVYYGAFDDGDFMGYGVVREAEEPEVMMIQAREHGRGVGTAILRRIQHDYDRFYTHADSFGGERLMRREGMVNVKGHLWRWAAGKDPKDMLEASVPFVYDIGKDKLVLGYPGYDTHDVTSPAGFTPGGIVEGTYEPGGKVTVWTASTWPWTVRHLLDLWKAQAPQMEVTSVEAKELDGNTTKLAGMETLGVGPYMNALVQSDPSAANAYKALSAAGGKVYVVGGAVRDYMQEKTPKDVDLLVSGLPAEEVMHALRQLPGGVNLTGKNFGVYRYHAGHQGDDVEIALPRTDKYEGGSRGKADITVDHNLPVEKDLERRDFTANSMAVSLDDGKLVDPYNGAHDIQRGVLRTTHPNSFKEDPTRLVRALTAHSRFGLQPDERTRLEMQKYGHMLQHESPDTLNKVVDKWMGSPNPAAGVRLAHDTGVLKYLFPEVDDEWNFDQRNPYHNLPLGEHLVHTLDNVSRLTSDPDVRLAALLHDIGKPASQWIDKNGVGHYYRVDTKDPQTGEVINSQGQYHESVGSKMADSLMRRRFNWPATRTTRISELVRRHMFPPFNDDVGARKFMNKQNVYADDLLHLREADQAGKGQSPEELASRTQVNDMRTLVEQQREMGAPVQQAAMAINGNDILGLGLKPGPAVGQVLQFLTNAVVENPELNTREQLIGLAQQQINALPLETRATA